jgi:mannose-6-phosphate isomerase-like protein (cupin superfamily)
MTIEPFIKELADNTEYQSLFKPPKTVGLHAGRVYLKPGSDCGQHTTGPQEEMLVFLSGQGQAVLGEKTFPVGVGKITYIPPQTIHNIKNTSNEPLVYIFCVAPASGKGENKNV